MWLKLRRLLLGQPARRLGDALGQAGEDAAAEYLRSLGYVILDRSVLTRQGEADLVARAPDDTIVIVEVKSRRVNPAHPHPPAEASVTQDKRAKLTRIARHLAHANHWPAQRVRVDIVGIDFLHGDRTEIRHHEGVIRLS
jgi:putative endonuclease